MKIKYLAIFAALLALFTAIFLVPLVAGYISPESTPQLGNKNDPGFSMAQKFTVYVGLNDKDTGTQLVSLDEARERLNTIAAKHVNGFTVMPAKGYWKEEDRVFDEETLVYTFYDVTPEQMIPMQEEMMAAMNQGAILVERSGALRMFYQAGSAAAAAAGAARAAR